ncbi:MAG: glycosyltransferase family 4 protein, partial [Bacteroidia bacterium]|nr:glycosyltransferase family 4 protein [Bacteroidia bacterium]
HAIAFHNVPFQQEKVDLASRKPNVLLYQGALNVGRGIELMISTMKLLPECELWLVGDGDIRETLEKQVQELQVDRQVTFWGKRPFSELFAITVQATIGLSLEEDLGENYRRSTPNKIFDYYQARLPMIVSDLPGIRSVFDPFPAGMILTNRTPEALASAIKELLLPSNYQRAVEIAEQAAIQYCWEHQIPQLLSSYEQLIHSQG